MTTEMNKKRKLTAIDLFAGAGGFSLAARELGIRVLAAIDNDRHACATYKANFVEDRSDPPVLISEDINTIDPIQLLEKVGIIQGQCDILMGGPPCQGYSAHRINDSGVDDPRNKLLLRYFDFVDAIRPKVFVVENVSGLLWPRHSRYLAGFLCLSKDAGYNILGPVLLNARDYGVPQNRRRVFIVGFRKNLKVDMSWPPAPTHFSPESEEVRSGGYSEWRRASSVFDLPLCEEDPNAVHMNHSPDLVKVFESTPVNGGSRCQSIRVLPCHREHSGHKDVYGRIDPTKLGPTMTTACVNPSRGRFLHPTENHGISVRHAARFQTFPDSFVFCGGLMAAATQIGNAVPVLLGKAVLECLSDSLLQNRTNTGGDCPAAVIGVPI